MGAEWDYYVWVQKRACLCLNVRVNSCVLTRAHSDPHTRNEGGASRDDDRAVENSPQAFVAELNTFASDGAEAWHALAVGDERRLEEHLLTGDAMLPRHSQYCAVW